MKHRDKENCDLDLHGASATNKSCIRRFMRTLKRCGGMGSPVFNKDNINIKDYSNKKLTGND